VRRLLLLIYALVFVDEVALLAMVPLVPTYRDAFDLSSLESGALLASGPLALVVCSVPFGVAGDRLGARRMTLAAGLLLAASCAGQSLAPDLWTLLAARFVFGMASATIWSAGLSWLTDSAGDRPGALSAVVAVAGAGGLAGPVFAGALADRAGRGAPFMVLAVLSLLVVGALFVSEPGVQRPHEHEPLRSVLALARRDAYVTGALALMLLGGFADGMIFLVGPAQLADAGHSATWIGVVLSVSSAVFIAFSALTARRGARWVALATGAVAAAMSAVVLLPGVVSAAAAVVVTVLVVRSAPFGVLYAITLPLGVRGARRAGVGASTVNGLIGFAWGFATFAGSLSAGALAGVTGARAVYGLLAGCCALTAAYLLALKARS
jgi:predicted MFS family arabinose efflux permease